MSAMLFDFLLVVIFFITFKFYDIYVATGVIIVGALVQVLFGRLKHGKYDKKQLTIFLILLTFGGMTLYFHNPIFIKWKPTVVFWLLAVVFLLSQYIGEKTITQRILSQALEQNTKIPRKLWIKLNVAWIAFFTLLGSINLGVAYFFSTEAWVNFKLYGVMGALLLFAFLQSLFLARYMTEK